MVRDAKRPLAGLSPCPRHEGAAAADAQDADSATRPFGPSSGRVRSPSSAGQCPAKFDLLIHQAKRKRAVVPTRHSATGRCAPKTLWGQEGQSWAADAAAAGQ